MTQQIRPTAVLQQQISDFYNKMTWSEHAKQTQKGVMGGQSSLKYLGCNFIQQ